MIYVALLRNQWRSFVRSFQGKRLWLIGLGLFPLALYVLFVLVVLGLFFDKIVWIPKGDLGSVGLLNAHLLTLFFGMLVLRFFFQRPPRMEILPYLHLPLKRTQLVQYFQAASLVSLHNVYPLLFFVPFWARYVAGGPWGSATALAWLMSLFVCLLLSHYLNTLIRIALDRYAKAFLIVATAIIGFQLIDQLLGAHLVNRASSLLFDPLIRGDLRLLLPLTLLTLGAFVVSSQALLHTLRTERVAATQRQRALPGVLTFGRSPIGNLIVLEMMMMWRNKRTKQYVLISIGVSTAYTALLLSDYNAIFGNVMAAAVGLFASGVFALNYGQLMFAWESRYFDGLLARKIQLQHMVLAKFMVLMGSCLGLFVLSLPLFFWLPPNLLMLHVVFLFYNAGVTSILMLALAVFNRKRVNSAEGSFFNYQGFSLMHWLWIIPTILPPALLLFFLEATPETAMSFIAMLGLISMLLIWPWSMVLSRFLARRKYLMAAGFRSVER